MTIQACVPLPLQVVIDDVGWWRGADGHERGEPFRTGIPRDHVPADYQAIVDLGRALGIRPQAAMILCEWDRENILRRVPTSTWMGANWDNARCVGPWLEEAATIIRDNPGHIELTLHGVGHEYWTDGTASRAEWHDKQGRMRPRDQVLAHLEAYAAILRQNDLGGFPTSFVPAAFCHAFGDGAQGLAAILADWGIRFISTPFASMHRRRETEAPLFGIDQGIITVDRGAVPRIPWYALDATPDELRGPILGLHWPNLLHADPARNGEVVARWVGILRDYDRDSGTMLAPSASACHSQLLYHLGTTVTLRDRRIDLDFSQLRRWPASGAADRFTLKVGGERQARFTSPDATILSAAYDPAAGQHRLTLAVGPEQARAQVLLEA
ncbi:MAG: hypothetical protein GXY76_17775 [Chloroflexi bacterium]|nr:hypothetical protein [Chloroflexota bacterium]